MTKPRTSRPSPTSRPKKPSSSALPALSLRPRATRVVAQRAASACAGAMAAGPCAGPLPPTVTGPAPACVSSRCTVAAAAPGARSGRQRTTQPSCRPGEAAAGGGQVRRRGQGARPGAFLDPCHRHRQRPVEVRTQAAGALPQPVGVAGRRGEQLLEQLAADPVLRLAGRAADQQEQCRDQGRALEDAPVGLRQLVVPVQDEPAQELALDRDGRRPPAAVAHGAAGGPGQRERAGRVGGQSRRGGRFVRRRDPALLVEDGDAAAQGVGHGGGHVLDPAARAGRRR